ncbi:FG-GAP-like repeat-containing protein [Alkalimonas sp. NCh-2]|uniref:FG-GAP-like repeat-containing protein n=1 Tax=Alkalimonas sp. NCh-2 TaxID=3144846 RepID=UPI0031F6DA8F
MASFCARVLFICSLAFFAMLRPLWAGTVWVDWSGDYYVEVPATIISHADELSPVLRAREDYPYLRIIKDGDHFRVERLTRAQFEALRAMLTEVGKRYRGDFSGDGQPDLLLQTRDGLELLVSHLQSRGISPQARSYSIGSTVSEQMQFQDINQNGRLDLVDMAAGTVRYAQAEGFSVAYQQGDYVGSLAGEHQVTPSGEFSYNVPLTLAPSTGQFQPQLSLNYSSGAPNGHLGVGWAIGGLRSIARCEQNLELNGTITRVDFSANDRFCLDGQQLIARNGQTYGANNTEYRTVQSSFERIVSKTGSGVTGPVSFEVSDTQGNTYFFGRHGSDNDALVLANNSRAFVWALKRVQDASGNFYTFHYQQVANSLEFYLTHVRYTGNGGINPGNEVRFIYEATRPDKLLSYVAGQAITTTQRLQRVESRANGNLLRRYNLSYHNAAVLGANAPSRLQSITACDANNLCLSPTQFAWNQRNFNDFTDETSGTISRNSRYKGHQMWDFNGDGLLDIAYVRNNRGSSYDHLYLIENTGTDIVERWQLNHAAHKSFRNTWKIVDMDKDGQDEIIYRHTDGYWYQIRYNGTGFTNSRIAGLPQTSGDAYTHVVDMDGDGLPELLHTVNNRLSVQRGTKTGFASAAETVQVNLNSPGPNYTVSLVPFDREDNTMPATDFTGNGKADFIMQVRQTYVDPNPPIRPCHLPPCDEQQMRSLSASIPSMRSDVLLPASEDGLYPVHHFVEDAEEKPELSETKAGLQRMDFAAQSNSYSSVFWKILVAANRTTLNEYVTIGNRRDIDQVQPADVNGDGLADILYRRSSDKMWFLRLNNGNGFEAAIPIAVIDQEQLKLVDIYGDGRLQVLDKKLVRTSGRPPFNFRFDFQLLEMVGQQFVRRDFFSDGMNEDYWSSHLIDMNGNGAVDFLRFSGRYEIKYRTDTGRDRIVQVVDGYNERTTVNYSTLAVPGVHERRSDGPSKNWGNGHLVRDIKGAVPVVRTVQTSQDRLTYAYTGGKMQVGRGMLGFEQVQITSLAAGQRTTMTYRQDGDYRGNVSNVRVEIRNPSAGGTTPIDPCLINPGFCNPDPCFDHRICQQPYKSAWQAQTDGFSTSSVSTSNSNWRLKSDTTTSYALRANSLFSTNSNKTQTRFAYPTSSTTRLYNTDTASGGVISTQTQQITSIDLFGQPLTQIDKLEDAYSTITSTTTNGYTLEGQHFGGRLTSKIVRKERRHHYGNQTQPAAITLQNSFGYDSRGRLTSMISDSGISTTYVLNAFGLITRETVSATGMASRVANRGYDGAGRYLLWEENALGQRTTYDYTNRGLLNYTQYANGQRVYNDYNGLGRLIRTTTTPANNTSKTGSAVLVSSQSQYWCTANTSHCPATASYFTEYLAPGTATRRVYADLLGREVRSSTRGFNGSWVYSDTFYDAKGRVERETIPYYAGSSNPAATLYSYDEQGRVLDVTRPDGSLWQTEYNGLTTVSIAPGNRRTTEVHNSAGDLVQVIDAVGSQAWYYYDANGKSTILAGPSGKNLVVRYDKWGNKTRITDPDAGVTNYVYNGFHELIRQQDAKGQLVEYSYDLLGRQSRMLRKTPAGAIEHDVETRYDTGAYAIGQVSSVEDKKTNYRISYAYDTFARKRQETIRFDDGATYTQQWSYDSLGRLRTETDATGGGLVYNYNSHHWLTSIDDKDIRSGGSARRYWQATAADALGNITQDRLGDRINRTRQYDANTGLLTRIQTTASGQPQLQNWHYRWDELGNLEWRRDDTLGNKEDFTYDTLNRVRTSRITSPKGNTNVTIAYNALGNITSKTGVGTYHYESARPHAVTRVTGARPNSYQYDANGNMVRDNERQLSYNSWNKPTRISKGSYQVDFSYDPFGNHYKRVEFGGANGNFIPIMMSSITTFIPQIKETRYIGNVELIRMGSDTWLQRRYVGGVAVVSKLATQTAAQSVIRYMLGDHLGSTHVVANANGVAEQVMSFDVFGARRDTESWGLRHAEASSGLLTSALTLRGYTGHEQIDDVGLVHMGGRVYDPILGRFLQADPFIQQPNNIQNFNRYSYVLNNPLNATDPSGYFFQMLVIWAVNYVAAATLTGAAFTAFTMAMTAYQYYGYAQMAVGAMRAIDGGGTAMANFAGGMAKGYAKGLAFHSVMGDPQELGEAHAARRSGGNGDSPGEVNNGQGTTSTDGHGVVSGNSSVGADRSTGANQNAVLLDSPDFKYAGGADGGLNQGRYVFTGQLPQQSNFWLNFTAGLADNFTWGLSEGFTSANSGVNKDSLPYKLAAIAGLRGAGKQATKTALKTSKRSHYVNAQLPTEGKVRYIPPKNWHPDNPLPRGPRGGYMDKFGNEWTKGPSRTRGQAFEWDVQRPNGRHWNISLDGKVTH